MKDSFILYNKYEEIFDQLSDEDGMKLLKAIFEYSKTGKCILDGVLKAVFIPIKQDIDCNNEKYDTVCERNRLNGLKGGRPKNPKKASGFTENPEKPKKPDNEYDNEYDNDNDNKDILNDFNISSNFEQNEQCDCIAKSTGTRCERKSTYNINGKNYCNQHSREILENIFNKSGDGIEPKKAKTFCKPTVEEIKAYCIERKNNIDSQYFFDYYESKGWMVGKNKMKDWKACVRTWEKKQNTGVNQKDEKLTTNPFLRLLIEKEKQECQKPNLLDC